MLTFLDDASFRCVGGGFRKSDVRIIYSSGRDLKELVSAGKCVDFYYRLQNSIVVEIPSLREDRALCRNVIEEILKEHCFSISPSLMNWYLTCPWYGNIRQLKAHLNRKMIDHKRGHLSFDHLDISLKQDEYPLNKIINNKNIIKLKNLKKIYIEQILFANRGNIKITSKQIGVSENTIRRII